MTRSDVTAREATEHAEARTVVPVTDYREVREAWLCPVLSADIGGVGDEHFKAGTVLRLDGHDHRTRRRALGKLLSRGGHRRFRDTALFPFVDEAIETLLASHDADGWSRFDVVGWARRLNQQLAAALVGLDAATTPSGGQRLYELLSDWIAGQPRSFDIAFTPFDKSSETGKRTLAAIDVIVSEFIVPSYERRVSLVEEYERGAVAEGDLPSDVLTLMAQRVDPAWEDESLRHREAMFILTAGVHTTQFSLVWALEELFVWLEKHPWDRQLVEEDDFLMHVMSESLRLHPVVEGFARVATDDVALEATGTTVEAGDVVTIHNGPPGLDESKYGADADQFNPHREIPSGVAPHAYAFGAGPHMCYGAPIVLGAEGVDGSLFYLLKSLVRAGAEPDPDWPRLSLNGTHGEFNLKADDEYRLRIPVAGRTAP